MSQERKIVVAVDESEESMYALSWCINNFLLIDPQHTTRTTTTTMILLYVKPFVPVSFILDSPAYLRVGDAVAKIDKYGRDLVDSVMKRAEAVYSDFIPNIRVEKKVGSGDAKEVICSAVENIGADILVMGSHDYGFFKRAILGSVSDHCVKHVKCPLVVVKRPKNGFNIERAI